MYGKAMGNFIAALNPSLGKAYRRDRWHSGTTGKGHNLGTPRMGRDAKMTSERQSEI